MLNRFWEGVKFGVSVSAIIGLLVIICIGVTYVASIHGLIAAALAAVVAFAVWVGAIHVILGGT